MSIGGRAHMRYTHQYMKQNRMKNTSQPGGEQVARKAGAKEQYGTIKLGIDWHADQVRVARMIDGAGAQPPQRMKLAEFLEWAGKQVGLAEKVYSCYEAGAGGFVLHRQLTALGVENVVVRPKNLDTYGKGVNNDQTDALALVNELDRYVRGNRRALAVVYVPSPEEEQRRVLCRQRGQLKKEHQRLVAMGRSLLLSQGYREKGWWRPRRWELVQERLPGWLVKRLESFLRPMEAVAQELEKVQEAVEALAPAVRPQRVGALTMALLSAEVCRWDRFGNRRQLGSYTGLTGGVSATGNQHADLPITKHGNKRIRHLLIQLAWRMVAYQSQSAAVQKWKHVLLNIKAHTRQRKRAIVALARQLSIDLWAWQTGRKSPEELGWIMTEG